MRYEVDIYKRGDRVVRITVGACKSTQKEAGKMLGGEVEYCGRGAGSTQHCVDCGGKVYVGSVCAPCSRKYMR